MADPLGTIASIVALLDLCGKVLKYLRDVKDGPKVCKRLTVELSATRGILDTLRETVQDAEASPQDAWSATIRSVDKGGGPLKQLGDVLNSLHDKLYKESSADGIRKVGRRLLWPFKTEDMEKLLQIIDRQKLLLVMALENDHVALSKEIWNETRSIRANVKAVDNIVGRLDRHQDDQERQAVLDWLTPIDYAPQQSDFIAARQGGTGQWLLNSDKFRQWLGNRKQTLFCPGMPGAGKTMITSIVVDHLRTRFENDSTVGIAYIYCNFRRQYEQKPTNILVSLLKQLIQGQSSIPESVKKLYEHHKAKCSRPSLDEISTVLSCVVGLYPRSFIMIDALDEFQVSAVDREKLLAELFNIQAKTETNLFATSRFIPDIATQMKGSISLEIRADAEDVRAYLKGHMSRLPACVRRSPNLQEYIETAIIKAVEGMFLLAQLQLNFLIDKTTPKKIREALERLPRGSDALDQAYQDAMRRIQNQEEGFRELAKQVLSWITYARRPLTTTELQHALAVEVGEFGLDEDNLQDTGEMISVCAGLVVVDDESNIIRLVHYTTQQYFERTQGSWFPEAETNIAKICVTYLSFDVFESGSCADNEQFEARLQLNRLYDYAASYWGHHVSAASIELKQSLSRFLQSEAKVSACSQTMMASATYRGSDYSRRVRKEVTAVHLAAYFGLKLVISVLLQEGHMSDCKDSLRQTPLSWAAKWGQEEVVKLLVDRDDVEADSKDKNGRTPLSWAAEWGQEAVVKLLVERDDVEADSKDNNGQTPLSWAVTRGKEAVVKLLVERDDVKADSKDKNSQTPLLRAIIRGQEAVVKLLVERDDVEADSKDKNGRTPLSWAAAIGKEAVVKLLIERDDVEADSKDNNGQTPLLWAVTRGNQAVVKLLVERDDVEADSKDKNGQTPLLRAIIRGEEAMLRLLVERDDVEADSKDKSGQTPLSWAAARGQKAVVELLVERDNVEADSKDKNGRTPLSRAVARGQEAVVKLLVYRDDVEADSKDKDGRTPLSWAVVKSQEVVKLLVERDDVEADSKDNSGRTPLSWAAAIGKEAVVKLLIERDDVEADSKDNNGQTPLLRAAARGKEAIVKLLMDRDDVKADSKDKNSQTPLLRAAARGKEAVVKLLVEREDVEADSRDDLGRTPLFWAAGRGREAIVELLLTNNYVDNGSKDIYAQTPLLAAAVNGHEAVLRLLLAESTVSPDSKDIFGRTPLSQATARGYIHVATRILEAYTECGITISSSDMFIASSPVPGKDCRIYCSVCVHWIPNINIHYHCGICSHGDFDVCQECVSVGAGCFDDSHKLIKRTVAAQGFVEVPE